jgi:purine-binding chemotaxis protein CheW
METQSLATEQITTAIGQPAMQRDVYGSFSLNGTEFAVPATAIKEVVNEQGPYISMPISPDYLLGLFNLRGMIIPVVDLRILFNLTDESNNSAEDKVIAIIEYGLFSVGLLFDRTSEVFDGGDKDKIEFSNSEDYQSVVQGAFKLDCGNRIVQIIEPHDLISLKHLPRPNESALANIRKKRGTRKQCISFEVGDSVCALHINAIREIITVDKIENSILAGGHCVGAINIRGNTVPVIDFGALLGSEPTVISYTEDDNEEVIDSVTGEAEQAKTQSYTVIVMIIDELFFGLLIKGVKSIISFYDEDMITFPVIGNHKAKMFEGCVPEGGTIETILLNHLEIFSEAEVADMTRGHGNLYKEQEAQAKNSASAKVQKETYILFTIENNYALEIHHVNEVIDYPENLLYPPNLPKHIRGMLNLRGTLVAIIDSRALFDIDVNGYSSDPKILIFLEGESKYGLIVDSIDSIATFDKNSPIHIPKCSPGDREKATSIGAQDIIQMDVGSDTPKTLLVMDIPLMIDKLNAAAEKSSQFF